MSEALGYLLSINATTYTNATHTQCTAAAMSTGAAAVNEAHDANIGGFYELKTADGNVSTAKVWWIQANAMLALWKLHQYYGSVGSSSTVEGADSRNGRQDYLVLLVETARFVRRYQTDNEVAGEQFWQVGCAGWLWWLWCSWWWWWWWWEYLLCRPVLQVTSILHNPRVAFAASCQCCCWWR